MDEVREAGQSATRFGQMADMRNTIEGNHVCLNFESITGDASGQNMVTLVTDAICKFVAEHCPIKPDYCFVEANPSGDKKATCGSFLSVRGGRMEAVEAAIAETFSEAKFPRVRIVDAPGDPHRPGHNRNPIL